MSNFIVTGGNGYIGSHMCKLLFEKGHSVEVVDSFVTSPKKNVHAYGNFNKFDIADSDKVIKLIKKKKIDGIFHFAARALVEESERDPILYYSENLVKTISLIKSAITAGVHKFVFSSTCATFGVPQSDKIGENHPQNPINSYGNTKKLIELFMRDIAKKGLMDFTALRYFNACGGDPDLTIGENHDPETHLIPNIVKTYMSGGTQKFKLFGTDHPTRDGTCVRDYIHVTDLASAHLLAYEYMSGRSGFFDFNLGTGKGTSVKEMIQIFQQVAGIKLEVELCDRRPGDPPTLIADTEKSERELGFLCKYSASDSVSHTLNWFKKKRF